MLPALARLVILCTISLNITTAQRIGFGACPEIKPMENFDMEAFSGNWTEVERSFYLLESALTCTNVLFDTKNNNSVKIDVTYKTPWRANVSKTSYKASMTGNTGIINMIIESSRLPPIFARLAPGSGKYIVIDTDYEHYALIYSCTGFRFAHTDFIWVLGRKKDLTADMRAVLYSDLDRIQVNKERLHLTRHENCV